MNIGLYFGTFNPVHIGHIAIAGYMAEFTNLDQVWFVLTPKNPLKEKSGLLKNHHRLALLRAGLEESDGKFRVCDIELSLPEPHYTIHTLLHLSEKYPAHTFTLIIGSDNLESFTKWKNHEQILDQFKVLVYPRDRSKQIPLSTHPSVVMTQAPIMEISSTFIRNAIKEGKDVRYFLTRPVFDYIREMHFYEK